MNGRNDARAIVRELPLRYARFWVTAGFLTMLIILGLALAPMAVPMGNVGGDKLGHFLAFLTLTVWFLGALGPRHTALVLLALTCYGVLIEYLQSLTPYRSPGFDDVVADVLGIAAGWTLASLGLRRWCAWVEGLLEPR